MAWCVLVDLEWLITSNNQLQQGFMMRNRGLWRLIMVCLKMGDSGEWLLCWLDMLTDSGQYTASQMAKELVGMMVNVMLDTTMLYVMSILLKSG